MSLVKTKVSVEAVKDGKETDVYTCTWDGDLGDWMDIGGEVGGVVGDHDKVVVTLSRINKKKKTKIMIEPKDIDGKKIKEIMEKDTNVLDKLNDGWDDEVIRRSVKAGTVEDIDILYTECHVFIFDKRKLRDVFYVYELQDISLNAKRGLITTVGHETTHQYWLDNGEYHMGHTR